MYLSLCIFSVPLIFPIISGAMDFSRPRLNPYASDDLSSLFSFCIIIPYTQTVTSHYNLSKLSVTKFYPTLKQRTIFTEGKCEINISRKTKSTKYYNYAPVQTTIGTYIKFIDRRELIQTKWKKIMLRPPRELPHMERVVRDYDCGREVKPSLPRRRF